MTPSDLVDIIEGLALDLASERRNTASYRLVAQQGLHVIRSQHVELERLRTRYHALRDDLRRVREKEVA